MRFLKNLIISFLLMSLFLETSEISYANTEPGDKLENVAVILVIDTSGSMETTDPQNLRKTAADIFIDLLSPEDYLGVITFNTSVEVVLTMQQVKSKENKIPFKELLSPKLTAAGDTNYTLALTEAKKQLDGLNDSDIRKVIVFLTDGTPDPEPTRSNDPVFMNDYMNSLWKSVSGITVSEYPVYSVGISAETDPQILKKISSETNGEYQGINDSAELASSFFQILSNLKNRNTILNKELNVKNETNLTFEFDKYTSQVTLVFTYSEKNPVSVSLTPPGGKTDSSKISVDKTSKYAIFTLNQINEELAGKWFVNIKGNGAVKAFGAKDLFIKTWIRKPVPDSIQSLNVPINIEAVITGEQKDKLYVEAQIKKNGVYEAFPVILKNNNGIYQGVYDKPGQTGTYDIEIRVFQGDQPVTGASSRVYVKAIPSVETDFYNNEKSFLTGKEIIVTSWLNLNDNLLKPNADLVIKSYQIKFNYIDGKEETTNLYDDGNPKNGDILTKDGIYSCKIKFTGIGMMKSSLITKGTYKGESFLLEKNLGKYQVYSPGALSIKQDSDQLYGKKGDTIEIPLLIKNTSAFLETINLSTDSSFGSFPVKQISAEPGEITETTVPFKLNKNLNEGVLEIPVMFTVGEPLTELTTKNINLKVEVVSGFGWIINKVFELLYILIPILLIPFVLVLTGLLLYRILVYPKTIVHGSLRFYESGNSANNKNLKLNSFRRPTVVISLNGDKKNVKIGDVKAWSGRFNYNLILTVIYEKGRWKFVEGYKALLKNGKTAKLMLRATEPGIFLYNGKGYTEKELFHGDIFETGGYLFQYLERNKPVEHEYGKDLLEGKI